MSGAPGGGELNHRQVTLIAVCTLCLVLSTVVVGLRLLARHLSEVKYWWDDAAAIAALVGGDSHA